MNIVNLSSEIEITPAHRSFLENILHNNWWWGRRRGYWTGRWCAEYVPVFLVNDDTMRTYCMENETGQYEHNEERRPGTEWLGFYQRRNDDLFSNTPVIAICPERIVGCTRNEEEFMFLFAKVLVHELAHADMDFHEENSAYGRRDEFFRWMEESSANLMGIEFFRSLHRRYPYWIGRRYGYHRRVKSYGNRYWGEALLSFVLNFIQHQPPEYALGYELRRHSEIRGIWWKWRDRKEILGGNKKANAKQDWLSYMKKNYRNIDKNVVRRMYNEVLR